MKLYIILQRPEGSTSNSNRLKFKAGKISKINFSSGYSIYGGNIAYNAGFAYSNAALALSVCDDGYILRQTSNITFQAENKAVFVIDANFNYDDLRIEDSNFGRVEFRNENGVLITDNGLPWNDGTYPPDAKNRADLTGLHAAPAAINRELETALTGDLTNEERVQE